MQKIEVPQTPSSDSSLSFASLNSPSSVSEQVLNTSRDFVSIAQGGVDKLPLDLTPLMNKELGIVFLPVPGFQESRELHLRKNKIAPCNVDMLGFAKLNNHYRIDLNIKYPGDDGAQRFIYLTDLKQMLEKFSPKDFNVQLSKAPDLHEDLLNHTLFSLYSESRGSYIKGEEFSISGKKGHKLRTLISAPGKFAVISLPTQVVGEEMSNLNKIIAETKTEESSLKKVIFVSAIDDLRDRQQAVFNPLKNREIAFTDLEKLAASLDMDANKRKSIMSIHRAAELMIFQYIDSNHESKSRNHAMLLPLIATFEKQNIIEYRLKNIIQDGMGIESEVPTGAESPGISLSEDKTEATAVKSKKSGRKSKAAKDAEDESISHSSDYRSSTPPVQLPEVPQLSAISYDSAQPVKYLQEAMQVMLAYNEARRKFPDDFDPFDRSELVKPEVIAKDLHTFLLDRYEAYEDFCGFDLPKLKQIHGAFKKCWENLFILMPDDLHASPSMNDEKILHTTLQDLIFRVYLKPVKNWEKTEYYQKNKDQIVF